MANGESKQNERNSRKRVEAETPSATLIRARNGSAFARCEECKSSVSVALIDMHNCSLEAKIKMSLDAQVVEKPTEVKKKSVERKKLLSEPDSKPKKKLKKSGDPDKPKCP